MRSALCGRTVHRIEVPICQTQAISENGRLKLRDRLEKNQMRWKHSAY